MIKIIPNTEVVPLKEAPVLLDAAAAFKVEKGYAIACSIILLIAIFHSYRRKELGVFALLVIGGFSIWWQELYADWATYLIWPETFTMLSWWGESPYTTPLKPAFLLWAYPVFMPISIGLSILFAKLGAKLLPNLNRLWVHAIFAGATLMLCNFINEIASVSSAGKFTYVDALGPALVTAHGYQPLIYPNIPFGAWGGVITMLILWRDENGYAKFESLLSFTKTTTGIKRQLARALTWVLAYNLTFWFVFTLPLILFREFFGRPHPLVP